MKTIFVLLGQVEIAGQFKGASSNYLVAEHYIQLKLDWKKKTYGEKILDAKTKLDKILNGTDFPTPWSPEFVTLATLSTHITDADAKLLARSENLPNSAKNLKDAVNLLYDDLKNIGTMVQLKMDTVVPDEAIRICVDAGYTYKAISVRGKRKNAVKQSTEPGVLVVEAKGEGPRHWQISPDGGAGIMDLPPTTSGVTEVINLNPKQEYWFRWRLVLPRGNYGEWSAWYSGFAPGEPKPIPPIPPIP